MTAQADGVRDDGEGGNTQCIALLRQMTGAAATITHAQMAGLVTRLAAGLLKLSSEAQQHQDARQFVGLHNQFRLHAQRFGQVLVARLADLFVQEIQRLLDQRGALSLEASHMTMANMVAGNDDPVLEALGDTIRIQLSDAYDIFDARLARLFGWESLPANDNPFRPRVFVQAAYDAWHRVEIDPENQADCLRVFTPDAFAFLEHVVNGLNQDLANAGILPDLRRVMRRPPAREFSAARTPLSALAGQAKQARASDYQGSSAGDNLRKATQMLQARPVRQAALEFLTTCRHQDVSFALGAVDQVRRGSAERLRALITQAPVGSIQVVDRDAIDVFTQIYDILLGDERIAAAARLPLIRLQMPLLQVVLREREALTARDHVAWRLIDAVAASAAVLDEQQGEKDPLYRMIVASVDKLLAAAVDDEQCLVDVCIDLEQFLELEQAGALQDISGSISEALRQEHNWHARKLAGRDIDARIATGEVAGFIERFLERQWIQVLGAAHAVADSRPETLEQVRRIMDELVWSTRPKQGAEARKALVTRLPALLFSLNSWINSINWDERERKAFMDELAERHATLMRMPVEMSPRQQLEMAVTVAQRASQHSLDQREREWQTRPMDDVILSVKELALDQWLEFKRANGSSVKMRLAWVSPMRTRYIFIGRQGYEPFSINLDQLVQGVRAHRVRGLDRSPVMPDVLDAVFGKQTLN